MQLRSQDDSCLKREGELLFRLLLPDDCFMMRKIEGKNDYWLACIQQTLKKI